MSEARRSNRPNRLLWITSGVAIATGAAAITLFATNSEPGGEAVQCDSQPHSASLQPGQHADFQFPALGNTGLTIGSDGSLAKVQGSLIGDWQLFLPISTGGTPYESSVLIDGRNQEVRYSFVRDGGALAVQVMCTGRPPG